MSTARLDGRSRVLGTLSRWGPLSQAELARRAALAPSTVSGLVADLTDAGVLVELADRSAPGARGGRPATLLTLHRSAGVVLGIDLGKAHVRVALADLAHRVIGERSVPLEVDATADHHLELARGLATDLLAEGAPGADVVGVGCGFPGPVRASGGGGVDPTILPGWRDVRPVERLEAVFGTAAAVGNDANLGVLSESTWGAGRGCSELAYVKVATGIGAGLVLRGEPFGGYAGTAGEIGHVSLDPGGRRCRCGSRGCLEVLAGGQALLARSGRASVREVVDDALAGDEACAAAIGRTGSWLGVALAGLANLLNPQRLVIGGEVAAAGELLLGPLRAALAGSVLGSAAAGLDVVPGELGERAEVMGAVALSLRLARPVLP
jgi:predicted NBD/HSP70 family sugar kinase